LLIRILHTISVRWWNACAYYAISIAEAQKKLGHEVIVAGDPGFLATEYARRSGLTTLEIPFAARNPFRYMAARMKLDRLVQEHRIEVINAHRPEDHLLASWIARKRKIPLIRTIGDVRPPRRNWVNRRLHASLTRHLIFSADANLTRYLSAWPELEAKSTVIHGGVDLDIFQPRPKNKEVLEKLHLDDTKIILGQIGRLSVVKDYPTTIKALALVLEERKDVHLVISGMEGKVKVSRLKELAASYDIDRHITFLGRYDPVEELISILDIGIVASKGSEAICRIAMEYMAMGIPVVAADVNVLTELVRDRLNGLIIHAEDPAGMAAALSELIDNADLRQTMRQNNMEDARIRINLQSAAYQTLGIYHTALNQRTD
jgi:glycosyltransferase involved in cell wall biosynthesis